MKKIFLYVAFVCASFLSLAEACDGEPVDAEVDTLASVQALLKAEVSTAGIALDVFSTEPERYSLKEFLDNFQPFIHKDLWDDFEQGWKAIYQGEHRLPAERETEHMRCLFSDILFAWVNEEKGSAYLLEQQKITIYSRFLASETHMNLLKIHALDVYKKFLDVE